MTRRYTVARAGRRLARLGVDLLERVAPTSGELEARLRRGGPEDAQGLPAPLPCPSAALASSEDVVDAIVFSSEIDECARHFADTAQDALVSAVSMGLLYSLVRLARPEHVVEIGTYRAATTRALCLALHANGIGVAHTVDAFNSAAIVGILNEWPTELRSRVRFYPVDSMRFFSEVDRTQVRPGVVFVDGNHDHEFALFDIESASRLLQPGGFLVVNSVSQAGPLLAVQDFLATHPGWRELGSKVKGLRVRHAFDRGRPAVPATDLCVLQGPTGFVVGSRPATSGEQAWGSEDGLLAAELEVAEPAEGTLHIQCVVRSFGPVPTEDTVEASVDLRGRSGTVTVPLRAAWGDGNSRRTVEPWYVWEGDGHLELGGAPALR